MEEEKLERGPGPRLMGRLFRYALPYWKQVLTALALLTVNSSLQVSAPLLTKLTVDTYFTRSERHAWLPEDPWRGLAMLTAAYLATILMGFAADYGRIYLSQWIGQHAMFDLRRAVFAHLQTLDVPYFDKNPVGRLVTRVTSDIDAINELFSAGIIDALADIAMLTLVLLTMWTLNPGLTLVLLVVMPFAIATAAVFRRVVTKSYRQTRIAVAKINAFLQEHIAGVSVLQLFNREAHAKRQFDAIGVEYVEAFRGGIQAYGWFYPVVEFWGMLALAGILAYGGFQIRNGTLTLGALVAFVHYGMRFFRPVSNLSDKYNTLQTAMTAAERVFQLLDERPAIVSKPGAKPAPVHPAVIEFDQVWFAYKGEDWILKDLSFTIEPHETIAVVGHTGAGKTTIINLLLRFYDIQRGSIRLGGVDLCEYDLHALRRYFGVVLQDPFLFTGTVESNIRLGDALDAERVAWAAEESGLSSSVALDTPVKERGLGLSTGQKQLVGCARALARDPRCVILDEATSSLDPHLDLTLRQAVERLTEQRTAIVIAHRLATIQSANRIFVMHRGQLRESGTHRELLALGGIYSRLYELQYKDPTGEPAAPQLA